MSRQLPVEGTRQPPSADMLFESKRSVLRVETIDVRSQLTWAFFAASGCETASFLMVPPVEESLGFQR